MFSISVGTELPVIKCLYRYGVSIANQFSNFMCYNRPDHLHKVMGRLRGLACLNLGVGIPEGCFIFDFTSLPLKVVWPI